MGVEPMVFWYGLVLADSLGDIWLKSENIIFLYAAEDQKQRQILRYSPTACININITSKHF